MRISVTQKQKSLGNVLPGDRINQNTPIRASKVTHNTRRPAKTNNGKSKLSSKPQSYYNNIMTLMTA